MNFRRIIVAFFRSHGIAEPILHLAEAGNVTRDRIYTYFQQADAGKLNIKYAKWLCYEAELIRREGERNTVADFFGFDAKEQITK